MSLALLLVSVAIACAVEAVEALTIVLAVGITRGWRSTYAGVAAGLVVLSALIGALGPAVGRLPLSALRVAIGGLLLVFGLQWLRKAILRASGLKPIHDEDLAYRREVASAEHGVVGGRFGVPDWYAFTVAFKGVLLEGLEVAFIVVTFGATQHRLGWSALAAAVAVLVVVAVGAAARAPLSRVPENAMKFGVGVMLTGFGVFWAGEGAGAGWPGGDLALPVLLLVTWMAAMGAVAGLRRTVMASA